MANTWDTSRVGGGTYEFQKDASGNYNLKSVGFDKLTKLNLPELKPEATKTTATQDNTKDTAALSSQTKQAFGDVRPFYYNQQGGAGADQSMTTSMTKDPSLTENLKTDTRPDMLGDYGGSILNRESTPVKENEVIAPNQIGRQNVDQVLADRQRTKALGTIGPVAPKTYRSETEKFKTRFDPTQIKAATTRPNVVQTELKKVATSLSPLAKSVGLVMNPLKTAGGIIMGAIPKDSPTDKFNRKYFNTVGNTSRIAGNPATDLYAGMNQTSAFGNTEKAGARRIATREKTIAKKGYKAGDKFFDDTQKMKGQQKNYKDSKDNNVVDKGFTRTRAERKANPGRQDANTMSGGGGNGGGGGRVICTELHRTHELSTKDWIRDVHFTFNTLTENHIKGYLIWAIPTVKHMKKYPKYRKIWKHIAQHRANDIAWRLNEGKFDLLGRIYAGIGEPLCWLIGNFTGNKQINELNITNWRKA